MTGILITGIYTMKKERETMNKMIDPPIYPASIHQMLDVLIVDDEKKLCHFLQEALDLMGHKAEIAGSFAEALQKLHGNSFDLAFIDINLPDGCGADLIPKIREYHDEVNIVAITADSSFEMESRVREQRVMCYLIKPFRLRHIRTLIDHILYRKISLKSFNH